MPIQIRFADQIASNDEAGANGHTPRELAGFGLDNEKIENKLQKLGDALKETILTGDTSQGLTRLTGLTL